MAGLTRKQRKETLRAQLIQERQSFLAHWRELGDYILPRRPRFYTSDVNKGDRRNQRIIDSTATVAARTLRSGMMGGVTSPARPWFRLTTPNPELTEIGAVKDWLHKVTDRMSAMFLRSNLYNALPVLYGDIGVFGTAAMLVEEDHKNICRFSTFPIGSYCIAKDSTGRINVFLREFQMTVRQIVEEFATLPNGDVDWSLLSQQVRTAWDSAQFETWIDVCHIISPNPGYNPNYSSSKYKKFESCYYERGATGKAGAQSTYNEIYLRESGFDYFPVLAPRWETTGEDVYGTDCPGMTSLGDIKAVQTMHKRKAQAIEKMVNPPMLAPSSLRNQKASILPGDITYVDVREGMQGMRPAHEVNVRLADLNEDIMAHESRIKEVFYADLFLMMTSSDRREITATEIDERKEEKLLALGPVLEQLNQDLLDPLISIGFQMMLKAGLIPEPPTEIQGQDLKVEYMSVMAQAQKLIGIGALEKFIAFYRETIQVDPSISAKVDADQMIETYGEHLSLAPKIVRTDEEAQAIRQQQQQAQAMQQRTEMMNQNSQTAKNFAQADTSGDNALTRMMDQAKAGQVEPVR